MRSVLDLRPGHRPWQDLPASSQDDLLEEELLAYAFQTSHEVLPLATEEDLLAIVSSWLAPDEWCLFFDASHATGPTSWFAWLRDRLGLKLYRLPAGSIADLPTLLAQQPNIRLVFAPQTTPATGEAIDLEELFFEVKSRNPDILCVADISHGLGLLPFYMDEMDCDAALIRRAPFGAILAAGPSAMPPGVLAGDLSPSFRPYLQAAYTRRLPAVWNATHLEAKAFRDALTQLGAELSIQSPGDAFTGFRLPGQAPKDTAQRLKETANVRVDVQRDWSHREHCIIQHAPDPPETLSSLHKALGMLAESSSSE